MASYRPFPRPPPPSSFPPPLPQPPTASQNPLPPPFPQQNQYPPFPSHNFNNPSHRSYHHQQQQQQQHQHHNQQPLPPPPPPQQQQYPFLPPPPPPQPSIAPQQPPSSYYPSSHYPSSQYNPPIPLPPPPPPLPPSSPPPGPPPAPPVSGTKDSAPSTRHAEANPSHHPHRKHRGQPPVPPTSRPAHLLPPNGRVETEEERRNRKRKEFERQQHQHQQQPQQQDGRRHQIMKQTQETVLQRTSNMRAAAHDSMGGSRVVERRPTPFLSAERVENRLKKPTTFLCKLKFRNDLPDPTAQPKLLSLNSNKDRYSKYAITSLEKLHKPKLYPEQDLGIPLDLLDLSVYNRPDVCPSLDPEDEELLRDGEVATPIKQDGGIRRKDRPTDIGVSWLVKTQYISPLSMDSAKLSFTEKQAKEIRETREGRNLFLENINNRERQIQAIEESFMASKLPLVHQTNPKLIPEKIMPLLPDFDRYDDQFAMVTFDGDPTADSEAYNKLDRSARDEYEAQAIMKSFVVDGSDPTKPEKFLAYMVPAPDELSKGMYEENEDASYSWIREYHWDVRGDSSDYPTTFLVNFDEDAARYLPLPTKLVLQKKKAKEGRSSDEIEHYPVPSSVTVRRIDADFGELKDKREGVHTKRGIALSEDDGETRRHKFQRTDDVDRYSEEEDMSV